MEALDRDNWKSGGGSFEEGREEVVSNVGAGVVVTTNSRHWGIRDVVLGLESGIGPERPAMVVGWLGDAATD